MQAKSNKMLSKLLIIVEMFNKMFSEKQLHLLLTLLDGFDVGAGIVCE